MENYTAQRYAAKFARKLRNSEEFVAADVAQLNKSYAAL